MIDASYSSMEREPHEGFSAGKTEVPGLKPLDLIGFIQGPEGPCSLRKGKNNGNDKGKNNGNDKGKNNGNDKKCKGKNKDND